MIHGNTKQLDFQYRDYLQNNDSIPPNTLIGSYKIIKQIGKGAFGKIYLAKDTEGQNFALKLMDLEKIKDETNSKVKEIRQRLVETEPKCMQECNSPNVLKCYQIFQSHELKILVLEYCNGKTLQEQIDKAKTIKERQAVKILRHIINGIAELHNHSIVHRDLKSENIMEHEGIYKIIDLGFSKKLQISNQLAEIKGTILGTVTTMAPEVLTKNQYGLKSDIWSLGVIFFQMVFGEYLYDSVSARHRLREIQQKKYFSPDKELHYNGITLSKQANDFLYRVLEVNTEKRMNWRELLEHPLIKQKEQEPLGDHFLEKALLEAPNVTREVEDRFIQQEVSKRFQEKRERWDNQEENQQKSSKENNSQKQKELQKQQKKQNNFQKPQKISISKIDINFHQQQPAEKAKQPENKIPVIPRYERVRQQQKKIQEEMRRPEGYAKNNQSSKLFQNVQDSKIYAWIKVAYLQCLKTQYIFTTVITPIQFNKHLDTSQRQVIQFMFLLCARCFNNMSPISFKIEDGKKKNDRKMENAKVENLYTQVKDLYMRVSKRFEEYSKKLTAAENGYYQMFLDFFKKRFFSQKFNQKSSFTAGVQIANEEEGQNKNNSQIKYGDYDKKQQIKYTCQNYNPAMIEALKKIPNTTSIVKTLQKYEQIMSVTLEDLKEKSFREYVNTLVE